MAAESRNNSELTVNGDMPPAAPPIEALTVDNAGAARLLGISESHLYMLKRTGRFGPGSIRLGRCCRYRVAELVAWVEAGCPNRAKWASIRGGAR